MQVRSEQHVAERTEGPLTVRKDALDLGREGVIGIRLSVRSVADRPLAIELTEEFPGHVSMSDVQVHPEYNPDRWSISEPLRRMVYSAEVPPDGELQTVYGVRVADGNLDPFLEGPRVEVDASNGETRGGAVINRDVDLSDEGADPEPRAPEAPADTSVEPAPGAAAGTPSGEPITAVDQPDSPAAEPADSLQELFQFGEDQPEADAAGHQGSGGPAPAPDQPAEASPQARVETLVDSLASIDLTELQRRRIAEALGIDAEGRNGSAPVDDSLDRLAQLVAELERVVDAARSPARRPTNTAETRSPEPAAPADDGDGADESPARRLSLLDREAGDRRDADRPPGSAGEDRSDAAEEAGTERSGRFTTDHEETIRSLSADSDGD